MADFAEGLTSTPPKELKLAKQIQEWHTLPEPGGLYDQPAGLMDRLTLVMNIYNTVMAYKHSDNWVELSKRNPEMAEVWQWISKVRDD